ncbi:MAG: DUF4965 domain-containing protein [Clostridia bacterium]|nr:DUF4965 domain-containing protein [Clostridia bacterium]
MRLRAPAYPLITIDPYFSVWSKSDKLTDTDTVHWTDYNNKLIGIVTIDGKDYRVMGKHGDATIPAMTQTSVDMTAFSTTYTFEENGVRVKLKFTSPIIPSDLYLLTRPVSYLEVSREIVDHKLHTVSVKISASEELCMDRRGDDDVTCETLELAGGKLKSVKMGTKSQKMLERDGDDLRIEWGYLYLTVNGEVGTYTEQYAKESDTNKNDNSGYYSNQSTSTAAAEDAEMLTEHFIYAKSDVKSAPVLFTFAYDDIKSIEYFHEHLTSYWNKDGALITDEIVKAHSDYKTTLRRCAELENSMFIDAVRAGGEKYAELLELSFRQTIAAHKLVMDNEGQVLFVSKECYSNGCAATVDVSYPSIPLFLIYNPELVKGMMRPIYKYAASEQWTKELKYDFAPHDAGRYPRLNGQFYGLTYDKQMPVEECGNMLVMEAAVAIATKDTSFANSHMDVLEQWVKYLLDNGRDPENQLCTDDFAGHLAHNCNLSLKAIMGIAGLGIIYGMNGNKRDEKKYLKIARDMAVDWAKRASNGDGSYRLAFDKPGTFSMKYNIVWDKLFGTQIMPKHVIETEVASYYKHLHAYGLPLDNRQPYTKSDWTVWTATLAEDRRDFQNLIAPMWDAFNSTPSRVPMTDWYWTITSEHRAYFSRSAQMWKGFRNRTVQGGLFIKLLEYKGIMKIKQ